MLILNLKRVKIFLTWFEIANKLIPINLKWLIALICYKKNSPIIMKLTIYHLKWTYKILWVSDWLWKLNGEELYHLYIPQLLENILIVVKHYIYKTHIYKYNM